MYKLSRSRIIMILAVCLIGIFFAVPNLVPNKSVLPSWWQLINLGLDLQGGSNLLLEVKMDEVLKERMNMIEDSVRQTLREHKIRYADLNSGDAVVNVSVEAFSISTSVVTTSRSKLVVAPAPEVIVIVVIPAATAVIIPVSLIVAVAVLLEV